MKFRFNMVQPSVELITEPDVFKKIEIAGRTCYKSEDKITETSAKTFVSALFKNKHMAMLEHANIAFLLEGDDLSLYTYVLYLQSCKYLSVTFNENGRTIVSGNIRSILERNVLDPIYSALISEYPELKDSTNLTSIDLIYDKNINFEISATIVDIKSIKDLSETEFLLHFYLTCKFITDRGVTHELVRHREFSFAQESTRYCNYSKDKFGNHLTFCFPSTYDTWTEDQKANFMLYLNLADEIYSRLTTTGYEPLSPQQARAILPNTLKSEIVVSGYAKEWKHFFDLRSRGTTGAPHPDIKYIADKALCMLNSYIDSINFENTLHL